VRQATLPSRRSAPSPAKTRPSPRAAWLSVVTVALLIAVVGAVLQVRRGSAAEAHLQGTGSLGGLTARLHDAGWLSMDSHDMDNQGGYQMPAQMMPGAPAGDDMRLGVPLTLVNTGALLRQFNLAEEFSLGGGRNREPRLLHSDTFGQLSRLAPGSAVDGVLYFDTVVPGDGDPPFYLQWTRDGRTVRIAVPMAGKAADHQRHP